MKSERCAAFESVQVQAQVSGQIISRDFKDGADVKKGRCPFHDRSAPLSSGARLTRKADDMLAPGDT